MLDEKTEEIIRKRDEKILKNLEIAKQRNIGFEENSLAKILYENKRSLKSCVGTNIRKDKLLKNLENKIIEKECFKR